MRIDLEIIWTRPRDNGSYSACANSVISKDQESIQSSTTPDPESDKITIRHHNQEPIGQPFPSR